LAQQAAGDDLALAAVVDVGGVEEDDAALDGALDDRLGIRFIERPGTALVLPVAHHPEAQTRNAQAGVTEVQVLHLASYGAGNNRFSLRRCAAHSSQSARANSRYARSASRIASTKPSARRGANPSSHHRLSTCTRP